MLRYLAMRLLLFVPAFLAIIALNTLLLSLLPGSPPSEGGMQDGVSNPSAETLRRYRQMHQMDRPTLLNTRFALRESRVRELLLRSAGLGGASIKEQRLAAQKLDDLGSTSVRHLVAILADDDAQQRLRSLAAAQLARTMDLDGPPAPAEPAGGGSSPGSAANPGMTEPQPHLSTLEDLSRLWGDWYDTHREDYEYSPRECLEMLFLDTRFADYISRLLALDLGVSAIDGQPVLPAVVMSMKHSLCFTLPGIVLATALALPLGMLAAIGRGGTSDRAVSVLLLLLYSMPGFFLGTVLLQIFTLGTPFSWLPTGSLHSDDIGRLSTLRQVADLAWHLVLPVSTYAAGSLALLGLHARSGMLEVMGADYVLAARARGLSEARVLLGHAARNASLPILTLLGSALPAMLGGSVVIEYVFGIPGLGLYMVDAVRAHDFNAVMAVLLTGSLATLVGILLADLACMVADPRVRLG